MEDDKPIVEEDNYKAIKEEIDLLKEKRNITCLLSVIVKQVTTTKYNKRVRPREFELDNLVLRRVDVGGRNAVAVNS